MQITLPRSLEGMSPRDAFPSVEFPVIEVPATIRARFALKNPDDRAKAKRAIEAAAKMLGEVGTVEIEFGEPL